MAGAADPAAAAEPGAASGGAVGGAGAAGAAGAAAVKHKRTPEETAYDAIAYLLTSLRTCHMAVAKSIHAPARRREDAGAAPGVPVKAAALNLALLLVGNMKRQPWEAEQAASREAELAARDAGATPSRPASPGGSGGAAAAPAAPLPQLDALTLRVRPRAAHLCRLIEEFHAVLFDTRRRFCHLLVRASVAGTNARVSGVGRAWSCGACLICACSRPPRAMLTG
jgi:hypothetical protein